MLGSGTMRYSAWIRYPFCMLGIAWWVFPIFLFFLAAVAAASAAAAAIAAAASTAAAAVEIVFCSPVACWDYPIFLFSVLLLSHFAATLGVAQVGFGLLYNNMCV